MLLICLNKISFNKFSINCKFIIIGKVCWIEYCWLHVFDLQNMLISKKNFNFQCVISHDDWFQSTFWLIALFMFNWFRFESVCTAATNYNWHNSTKTNDAYIITLYNHTDHNNWIRRWYVYFAIAFNNEIDSVMNECNGFFIFNNLQKSLKKKLYRRWMIILYHADRLFQL